VSGVTTESGRVIGAAAADRTHADAAVTAIHEAAHVCVAWRLGHPIRRVCIMPFDERLPSGATRRVNGLTVFARPVETWPTMHAVIVLLAGLDAGARIARRLWSLDDYSSDVPEARRLLAARWGCAPDSPRVTVALEHIRPIVAASVSDHWTDITRIAAALQREPFALTRFDIARLAPISTRPTEEQTV
jgi:hypothetical protein